MSERSWYQEFYARVEHEGSWWCSICEERGDQSLVCGDDWLSLSDVLDEADRHYRQHHEHDYEWRDQVVRSRGAVDRSLTLATERRR